MADIEKGLPNIKTVLPGGAEEVTDVNIAEVPLKGPIDVTTEEDGGATIDFDPNANLKIPLIETTVATVQPYSRWVKYFISLVYMVGTMVAPIL